MRNIALAALVAASLGFAPVEAAPRPAIQIARGVTQPVFSYEDAIRETVYVQSYVDADGDLEPDLLATDIIRPRETERGLRVPVIYEMSPYYQSTGRGNESEIKDEEDGDFVPQRFPLFYDNYFVPRGYAVVLQDMRGTRNSEGCMVLGGEEEALDAQATVDWLNGRNVAYDATGGEIAAAWTTGKVGMIGKSYDGSVANAAATTGVKGLTTIVPIAAISRWYDYHLNNGVQYLNAYLTPANFSFVIDQEPGDDEERGVDWAQATVGETGPCSVKGAEIVARAANPVGSHDDFWDHRDFSSAKKVRASVFLVHGLNDWNVKPNNFTKWWDALARRGVKRKIWLSQAAHDDPFDFRREKWVETLHRWFDHTLHGIDNGIAKEPRADVEVRPGVWRRERDWPAPGTRFQTFFLGDGALTRSRPEAGTVSFSDNPLQSESAMVSNPDSASPNRLLFLTPKLRRAVRISGTIEVDIRASIDRPDANLTALLVDYGRSKVFDGVTTQQREDCWGGRSARDDGCYRKVRPTYGTTDIEIVSRGWLDAKHRESEREVSAVVPGETYRLRWEIFGDDWTFGRGHRMGIVIAGSDASYTIPDPMRPTVTVELGASKVRMPIAPSR